MNLVESILTENPCYKEGRKITVKGLMLHSVGVAQPNAMVFVRSWNTAAHDNSCVHAFIDANDGTIYQTIASNHSDPEHLWTQLSTGYTMDSFRRAVKELMDKEVGNANDNYPPTPFSVKVLIDNLNIRAYPNFGDNIKGQTGRGTFTIVEVRNGWGRLKNGIGWIWLEEEAYCTILDHIVADSYEKKSIDEVAMEVINGKWGNGEERKRRLTEAGYDYYAVQKRVNELIWY